LAGHQNTIKLQTEWISLVLCEHTTAFSKAINSLLLQKKAQQVSQPSGGTLHLIEDVVALNGNIMAHDEAINFNIYETKINYS